METHEKDMPFPCVICGKRFATLQGLSKHKAVHRSTEDYFRCRQCGKRFLAAADFVRHKLAHQRAEHEEELDAVREKKKEMEIGDRVKKGEKVSASGGFNAKSSPKVKRHGGTPGTPGGGGGGGGARRLSGGEQHGGKDEKEKEEKASIPEEGGL